MKNQFPAAFSDPSKNLFFFLTFGTFAVSIATEALSELIFENLESWTEQELGIVSEVFRVVIFLIFMSVIILVANWQTVLEWFGLDIKSVPTGVEPVALTGTFDGLIVVMIDILPRSQAHGGFLSINQTGLTV